MKFIFCFSDPKNHCGPLDFVRYVKYSEMDKHPCPNCTRWYKRRSHMLRHYRYECGVPQRFECPYCHSRLRQRTQVWAHIKKLHQNHQLYCTDVMTNNVLTPQWLCKYRDDCRWLLKINVYLINYIFTWKKKQETWLCRPYFCLSYSSVTRYRS